MEACKVRSQQIYFQQNLFRWWNGIVQNSGDKANSNPSNGFLFGINSMWTHYSRIRIVKATFHNVAFQLSLRALFEK